VRKNCDVGVRIPLSGGIVSSLNVSVAAGILLCEIVSQAAKSDIVRGVPKKDNPNFTKA
jgi:tRNA G18 (ribose-2'-O)-methylase SpoU